MTEPITIDATRALELLRQVVAGRESFTYARGPQSRVCVYERDGAPSCLVGHALHLAGLTVAELSLMDSEDEKDDSGSAISDVPLPERVTVDVSAREVFAAAQGSQDAGHTWGHALSTAEAEMRGELDD